MDDFGRKKPAPDFIIRFDESGIRPWKVPMRTLARVLQAIQRMVDQREEELEEFVIADRIGDPVPTEDYNSKALRLVDVRSSSATYTVATPAHDTAIKTITSTGRAIANPSKWDWSSATLSAVKELSEISRSLGSRIEIRLPGLGRSYGDVLATIRADTFAVISSSAFIKGETSIFAKIERVGGATAMHCGIRLADQPKKMVICHVASDELIRELGRYMYQHVLLNGNATWLRASRNLKYFTVTSFEPPKRGSIREAFEKVHEAGGKAWDKVADPAALLAEIRGS